MGLLGRVASLVGVDLNDLIDRAENPEDMIKQVTLDMENQLMQVKTQVAIAIADEHLLLKKQKENEDKAAEWARKAEIAVDNKQDDVARLGIERGMACRQMAESFAQQVADQKAQVETLKSALHKLELKLQEAQSTQDTLTARRRESEPHQERIRNNAAVRQAEIGTLLKELHGRRSTVDRILESDFDITFAPEELELSSFAEVYT